ncbi:MAG: gephyrin-like molybdotransferase Glp [Planctomycetota bacterium]
MGHRDDAVGTTLNSPEQVREEILARLETLPPEEVALADACGRFLAEPVFAVDDMPPFDNTALDGFAVRAMDTSTASAERPTRLPVSDTVEAGRAALPHIEPGSAARIYTGAPMPPGTDAVVPFEATAAYDAHSVTLTRPVVPGAAVRPRGNDFQVGQMLLPAGTPLTPAAIGLLATAGCARVRVGRRLRVAVHSTGNELVPVESPLGPGTIRNSNLYAIGARLQAWGAIPLLRPVLLDTPEAVRAGLLATRALAPDVILTTGGVSAGDLDFVREVARELGTDVRIRAVNMKPGKPLVDGLLGTTPFFGLPGNPAACLVSFEVFVRPALAKLEGRPDGFLPRRLAVAGEDLPATGGDRWQFVRAQVHYDAASARYVVRSTGDQGSHRMTSFAQANCLALIPPGSERLRVGSQVEVLLLSGPIGEAPNDSR